MKRINALRAVRPRVALAAWLGSTLVATSLAAQTGAQPDHPGRWTPLENILNSGGYGPLPSETRAMKAQLDALVAILRRNPALAEPRGFDIIGSVTVESDDVPVPGLRRGWQPVRGMVLFIPLLWYRPCDTCAALRLGEGFGIKIWVNKLPTAVYSFYRCGGPAVLEAPREVARIGGFPLFSDGVLLIAARDVPPYLPVTRDEWIQAVINDGMNQSGCNRPDDMAASWEHLRSTWTPEERAVEAWGLPPGRQPPGRFDPLGVPHARGARQWVRANPALFDSTLPRATMQTIMLKVGFPRNDPRWLPPGARRPLPCSAPLARTTALDLDALAIHEAAMCNLDWTALRALLR